MNWFLVPRLDATKRAGVGPDEKAPAIFRASLDANGITVRVRFTEKVTGINGFGVLEPSGISISYVTGEGTKDYVFELDIPVLGSSFETLEMEYSEGDIKDLAENPLPNYELITPTNNSELVPD